MESSSFSDQATNYISVSSRYFAHPLERKFADVIGQSLGHSWNHSYYDHSYYILKINILRVSPFSAYLCYVTSILRYA